jgi:DNA invertase Pin-like site-specific DNA recombinase
MNNAIGYIRVSTEEQAKDGISLDMQEQKIKQYCKLHDLELKICYMDQGKSGKNMKRSGLQGMLNYIKKNTVNNIIVYKLDRLSRRTIDILSLIDTFTRDKAKFHSITERIDTNTAQGKFFLTIIAALSQMERDLIAERTKDALQYKKENGEVYGQIPYGYTRVNGNGLTEDPEEQKVINDIKALYYAGYTYNRIAARLNNTGVETKTGKRWYHRTVKLILERS